MLFSPLRYHSEFCHASNTKAYLYIGWNKKLSNHGLQHLPQVQQFTHNNDIPMTSCLYTQGLSPTLPRTVRTLEAHRPSLTSIIVFTRLLVKYYVLTAEDKESGFVAINVSQYNVKLRRFDQWRIQRFARGFFSSFFCRSLMIGWRKNSWNAERVPSVVTFVSVCLCVCPFAGCRAHFLA